ncbi:30S ribosomal protein S10 [Candidatus Vidania fulgoroideorum]
MIYKNNLKILLISLCYKTINYYTKNFLNFLNKNFVIFKGPLNLPKEIKKFDILRSPHKDKDSRDQFEIRKYKRLIILKFCNKYIFKKIINLSIPSSVEIKIF